MEPITERELGSCLLCFDLLDKCNSNFMNKSRFHQDIGL